VNMFYNDPKEGPLLVIAYRSVESIEQLRERGRGDIADCLAGYGHLLPDRTSDHSGPGGYTSPEKFIALIRDRYGDDPHTRPQVQTLAEISLFGYARQEADGVADFLERYYKPERYHGRGQKYADGLLASYEQMHRMTGYIHISKHDSVTGRVVSWFGPLVSSKKSQREKPDADHFAYVGYLS
jgi:hypothetical protein